MYHKMEPRSLQILIPLTTIVQAENCDFRSITSHFGVLHHPHLFPNQGVNSVSASWIAVPTELLLGMFRIANAWCYQTQKALLRFAATSWQRQKHSKDLYRRCLWKTEMAERGGEFEEVVIFPPGKVGLAYLNLAHSNSNVGIDF